MLAIEGVTVDISGVRPLDDVTVSYESGSCGLIGPNGAGKTSLFNVLSGFMRVSKGRITMDGEDLLALAPHQRARHGLRRTFQQEQVIKELSALDNLRLAADNLGGTAAEVARTVEFLGLERPRRRASALSMFERRLVEIGRALVSTPRVLLLDEPGAGLAEPEVDRLSNLIRDIPSTYDCIVVLVDHDMELVSGVCTTTAVLDFGKLIAFGETSQVLRDPRVASAYLGTEDTNG
jgi:ABC-type branched-subunit amino acid transport system ATPase component